MMKQCTGKKWSSARTARTPVGLLPVVRLKKDYIKFTFKTLTRTMKVYIITAKQEKLC